MWGGYLNSNLTSQDSLIKTATDLVKNVQTSVYVCTTSDRNKVILADATAGAFNVTLPAPSDGFTIAVKKTDATANAITVVGTIDGAVNLSLPARYNYVLLVSDGTAWNILAKYADVTAFATDAEVKAETVSNKAIAPDTANSLPGVAKAWANVTSAGVILRDYRVTSVTRTGTGVYNVVLDDTYADTNYAIVINNTGTYVTTLANKTTTGFQVQIYVASGAGLADGNFAFIIMDT